MNVSDETARHVLRGMVEKKLVRVEGKGRSARYELAKLGE